MDETRHLEIATISCLSGTLCFATIPAIEEISTPLCYCYIMVQIILIMRISC